MLLQYFKVIGISGSSPFIFIWYLTMQAVAEMQLFINSLTFTWWWMVLSILYSRVFGLPAWYFASVPELNVLAGETLLNQDKEPVIVMYFQSLTYTCISTNVCQTLQRRLVQRSGSFIQCLTGTRYHAQLKVTALLDREMGIFLRICCFGCSLKLCENIFLMLFIQSQWSLNTF